MHTTECSGQFKPMSILICLLETIIFPKVHKPSYSPAIISQNTLAQTFLGEITLPFPMPVNIGGIRDQYLCLFFAIFNLLESLCADIPTTSKMQTSLYLISRNTNLSYTHAYHSYMSLQSFYYHPNNCVTCVCVCVCENFTRPPFLHFLTNFALQLSSFILAK